MYYILQDLITNLNKTKSETINLESFRACIVMNGFSKEFPFDNLKVYKYGENYCELKFSDTDESGLPITKGLLRLNEKDNKLISYFKDNENIVLNFENKTLINISIVKLPDPPAITNLF